MRAWVLPLVVSSLAPIGRGQSVDAEALLRKSIENYERDWKASMSWTYTQRDITRHDGTEEVDVSEVFPLDGTPYERLVMKNGHKLTPEEERREQAKYRKAAKQRESESPEERAARINKYGNERAFLRELPEAYDAKFLGEDSVEGRPAWVLQFTPKPGYTPRGPHADILRHVEGKLWIDKADVQWAKAQAHVIGPVSIGWILARVANGAQITLEQARVENGLWMTKSITVDGAARVLLVHNKDLNEQITFSGYRPAGSSAAASNGAQRVAPVAGAHSFR